MWTVNNNVALTGKYDNNFPKNWDYTEVIDFNDQLSWTMNLISTF